MFCDSLGPQYLVWFITFSINKIVLECYFAWININFFYRELIESTLQLIWYNEKKNLTKIEVRKTIETLSWIYSWIENMNNFFDVQRVNLYMINVDSEINTSTLKYRISQLIYSAEQQKHVWLNKSNWSNRI